MNERDTAASRAAAALVTGAPQRARAFTAFSTAACTASKWVAVADLLVRGVVHAALYSLIRSPSTFRPNWCAERYDDRRVVVGWLLAGLVRAVAVVVARRHGEDPAQRRRGMNRGKRGEPDPVGGFVPHPPGVPAQHRVRVPEHQQRGVLRPVTAEHQHSQAE
jgi:hypothetical protein